ncbi:sodium-dependent bicarbonate transport family permease [Polynucleobacter sp. QLW-P1DATA-2]|uniref:sodium-dependent bicarbonate transport family permease n=1 Tax=unclassified Polynucleobacter TaxID=2640945 RepID=UPI0008F8BF5A|nr:MULTISPECIES: sodium-dependent bicarbonate transport family permease [unclassified Polynucleobacter]OIM97756.1 sodium-dependent bicarbonate transport family permease [Polynucleobacter sp. MWH-Tro8-2-5-gr]OIN03364.1 sodium-dependent bicarbonate transport family permease [Polynucleobacter sp. QLW-P1DATA-2]
MTNLLDPSILFFIFGIFAGLVKSNLEIPQPISRFLSLYLLMALGLKGGFALNKSGFTPEIAISLGLAIALAVLIPLLSYNLLKHKLDKLDAAAIAATYGSISAVTFITTTQVLDQSGIAYGGHMAAAMALMESPAIIIAIVLANRIRQQRQGTTTSHTSLGKVLHESFTDGGQLLLLGSLVVGLISGDSGHKVMAPFSIDLFKGLLAFFLLDMGLVAARSIGELKGKPPVTLAFAFIAPPLHALLALALCHMLSVPLGDTILLMLLAASASYIAVPAVLRHAMPEVNPALYMGMSLGITFPLNIILGILIYSAIARYFA